MGRLGGVAIPKVSLCIASSGFQFVSEVMFEVPLLVGIESKLKADEEVVPVFRYVIHGFLLGLSHI